MTLDPGTIVHWRDFATGRNKFVYILGVTDSGQILSFTISSQLKYLDVEPHRNEMIEIPMGTVGFLNRRSFIQCFHWIIYTPTAEFLERERLGDVTWCGCLPQFLPAVLEILDRSELLCGYDQESALSLLRPRAAFG